ncbi:PDZ domain-containing protein [Thermoflavifilum thermophilum]|uniref:PDZ domain-containing protein n=1 Tax=Thermoflavifilum thermophilum TaxID=1393122 RepID=A0A1I7N8N4_9BACT|nr:PDZ domain-containing protein [Thermoflavifilum thermophilum]SFV31011.1 PDZ domain-containing protein [Thermoflavifilum thermophilum]
MKRWIFFLLCSLVFTPQVFAQDHTSNSTPGEYQEIIIRQRGQMNPNLDIHIKGGEIWINGKKYDQYSDSALTVIERKIPLRDGNSYIFEQSPNPHIRIYPFQDRDSNGSSRALLGVMTAEAGDQQGAKIEEVMRGTAADSAGLLAGDIITKVDDHIIHSPQELADVIRNYQPGDEVTITYLRNHQTQTTKARLGKQENNPVDLFGANPLPYFQMPNGWPYRNFRPFGVPDFHSYFFRNPSPKLGMTIQDTEGNNGVKVLKVTPDMPAAKAGVKPGDIVTQLGDQPINNVDDMLQALRDYQQSSSVTLKIKRNNETRTLTLTLPQSLKKADL